MVLIRQRTKKTSSIQFIIPLLLGILIGKSWNYLFVTKDIHVPETKKSSEEIVPVGLTSAARDYFRLVKHESFYSAIHDENSGWHPIYVYYGDSNGLNKIKPPLIHDGNRNEGSQVKQDEIVNNLVNAFRTEAKVARNINPYFVDLAANDAVALSNTYRLEKKYDWDGLCIEPNPVYWYRLAHRKCTVAAAFVGGKSDKQQVDVILKTREFGGIVGEEFDNNSIHQKELSNELAEKEMRYTISIKTMFEQFEVPKLIDYLSLDVEGAELLIMNDFPFDKYKIRFITIERPKPQLQALMQENDYQFVAQLVSWGETLWVHKSVMETLSKGKIDEIVSKTKLRERKRDKYFDMKTGTFITT